MALSNLAFAIVFTVALFGCLSVIAVVWWRRPKMDR
jgi:hypothetical protein